MQQEILTDLDNLMLQMKKLKADFLKGISDGKSFIQVKVIHLQIKELSRLIQQLTEKQDRGRNHDLA